MESSAPPPEENGQPDLRMRPDGPSVGQAPRTGAAACRFNQGRRSLAAPRAVFNRAGSPVMTQERLHERDVEVQLMFSPVVVPH